MSETKELAKSTQSKRVYKLHYRVGKFQEDVLFEFLGGLKDATNYARRHCLRMNWIFIFVKPGIVDFEHQEHLKNSDPEYNAFQDESVTLSRIEAGKS